MFTVVVAGWVDWLGGYSGLEIFFALLTLGGLAYMLIALWGARDFGHYWRRQRGEGGFAPDVTILKPVKGVDPQHVRRLCEPLPAGVRGALRDPVRREQPGRPAAVEVARLQAEFPGCAIRLVECRERLGTSGKVSNLVQMLREAQYEHVLINDSDIYVWPRYLTRVMASFADARVGMVTTPYIGRAIAGAKGLTVWSRLEALGISTDFLPGVLTARKLEGGIRFGLGSTLATTKTILAKIGGLEGAGRISGRRLRARSAHRRGRLPRGALRRGGGDDRAGLRIPRRSGSTSCAGRAPHATRAAGATWASGSPTRAVGGDDRGRERL